MRRRLRGEMRLGLAGELGRPLLYYLSNCPDSIRTLPTLQHDETDFEDLDTDGEDHIADADRYACMSRPWTQESVEPEPPPLVFPKRPDQMTINEHVERLVARRRAREEY
jgi:hypothetical protein